MVIKAASYTDGEQVSGALLFRRWGVWIAWATQPNDPWIDENQRAVRCGVIRYTGDTSDGKALVIGRLKLGGLWRK